MNNKEKLRFIIRSAKHPRIAGVNFLTNEIIKAFPQLQDQEEARVERLGFIGDDGQELFYRWKISNENLVMYYADSKQEALDWCARHNFKVVES